MSHEGTPLVGPLPLELQQIKAQTDAAAAALLASRRKSEDVKNRERNILKIRRRSCGIDMPHDDAVTRRSSRAIKRKKFDDELSRLGQPATPATLMSSMSPLLLATASPLSSSSASAGRPPSPLAGGSESRSRNASMCQSDLATPSSLDPNSCQALPDLRLKKSSAGRDKRSRKRAGGGAGAAVRREGAIKDLGRWKPTDDLLLLSAVEQTKDLGAVIRVVKFSCHFTLAEIQERWYALMYDPVICQLAGQAIRNLPSEVVQRTLLRTPFSKEEEDAIINAGIKSNAQTVSLADFERLLEVKSAVFHPCRTGRALLTHWQFLKQYSLLPEQTVQPIPRPDSTQHILNFQDGEELVVDSELIAEPGDTMVNTELLATERMAKREIRRVEAECGKWQLVVEQLSGNVSTEFDSQTLAVLRGRLVRYLMRSREITVGRAAKDHIVDVDLTLEGPASKISRRHAVIKLKSTEFHLANEGSRAVMVNGRPVLTGESVILHNNAVVEFSSLRFIFLINADLINAIRLESAKAQTASTAVGRT